MLWYSTMSMYKYSAVSGEIGELEIEKGTEDVDVENVRMNVLEQGNTFVLMVNTLDLYHGKIRKY